METHIAFLRAINVGGRTVKMERLRSLVAELGFEDVATFIASGNVIFRAPAGQGARLEQRIEAHLEARLGFRTEAFIRTASELTRIVAHRPFGEGAAAPAPVEGDTLYIGFLRAAPDASAHDRLRALDSGIDSFVVHGSELYWRCRKSISESPVTGSKLEKALGMPTTLRNITTVSKLAAKYGAAPAAGA